MNLQFRESHKLELLKNPTKEIKCYFKYYASCRLGDPKYIFVCGGQHTLLYGNNSMKDAQIIDIETGKVQPKRPMIYKRNCHGIARI